MYVALMTLELSLAGDWEDVHKWDVFDTYQSIVMCFNTFWCDDLDIESKSELDKTHSQEIRCNHTSTGKHQKANFSVQSHCCEFQRTGTCDEKGC